MVILTVIILDFSTIYIWTYKRYDKHPCHVYMRSTPGVMGYTPGVMVARMIMMVMYDTLSLHVH